MINEYQPTSVSPPGATLEEALEDRKISPAECAARMGLRQTMIELIIEGRMPITRETANQLSLVTGIASEFWIARERAYRLYVEPRSST